MSDDDDLAEEILVSLSDRRQIPRLTSRPGGLTISRAYRVGALVEAGRAQRGEHPVGRKIGFTNTTIWDEYNVTAPIVGRMYESTVRPLGAPFPLGDLLEPRIEPEIAFRLSAVPMPGMAPDALMACVSEVCAGFELVQSLFAGWSFEAADTVAAFGLHGAFLHGPVTDLADSDREEWTAALSTFETTLRCKGGIADRGHARNVLGGGPLVALGHLARLVGDTRHVAPLRAGEIVTTGTLTRALPVSPGETWRADFGGLPLEAIEIELT